MTTPDRFGKDNLDRINAAMDGAEAREQRISAFLDAVEHMPGPLGALLRSIGAAHRDYIDAEYDDATTMGEYRRMSNIVDAALIFQGWLADGEHPNPEPDLVLPARRRWLFGRKRGA